MALQWMIGDFVNGSNLEFLDAVSDSVSIDIFDEGDAEVVISRASLTPQIRGYWKNYFQPLSRFVALVDTDKAWDSSRAVLFAGFINKVSAPIGAGTFTLQVTSLTEYLKMRYVGSEDRWDVVTAPKAGKTFRGDSWRDVMLDVITSCFSAQNIPFNAPRPPQVLGDIPERSGTDARKKVVLISEMKTYYDVLDEVRTQESQKGQEWRFIPRWADATMSRIVWDVRVGTNANPQINSNATYDIELSEHAKISAFSSTLDSTTTFTKLWGQSKAGDEEKNTGMDLVPTWVTAGDFPILAEEFFSAGVELPMLALQEQIEARIEDGGKIAEETSFTIEEVGEPKMWANRVGSILTLFGVTSDLAAGYDVTVRLIGVSWRSGYGTLELTVATPAKTYPRMPKSRAGDMLPKKPKSPRKTIDEKPEEPSNEPGGGKGIFHTASQNVNVIWPQGYAIRQQDSEIFAFGAGSTGGSVFTVQQTSLQYGTAVGTPHKLAAPTNFAMFKGTLFAGQIQSQAAVTQGIQLWHQDDADAMLSTARVYQLISPDTTQPGEERVWRTTYKVDFEESVLYGGQVVLPIHIIVEWMDSRLNNNTSPATLEWDIESRRTEHATLFMRIPTVWTVETMPTIETGRAFDEIFILDSLNNYAVESAGRANIRVLDVSIGTMNTWLLTAPLGELGELLSVGIGSAPGGTTAIYAVYQNAGSDYSSIFKHDCEAGTAKPDFTKSWELVKNTEVEPDEPYKYYAPVGRWGSRVVFTANGATEGDIFVIAEAALVLQRILPALTGIASKINYEDFIYAKSSQGVMRSQQYGIEE